MILTTCQSLCTLTTAELPGYVAESDPEEDPEEYEDDEDDADDKDEDEEDEEEEEEEEHLASANAGVVVPTVKPERLARCTASFAHSSPPPVPSPLLPSSGCPTQIQTLRIASTEALIDAVTAALPSPALPPLPPPLYIPPPVDRMDDIPETKLPPRKKSCLFALGPRYEVGESSTARPTRGRGIDYGFVSTLDVEARRRGIREVGYGIMDTWVDPEKAVPEIAPMTLGERVTMDSQRVDLLMEDRIAHQKTILIVEEEAYASREIQAHQTQLQLQGTLIQTQHQVHKTCFQMQQAEMAKLRETDRRRQAHMVEILRVMGDVRREMGDMHAELLALREQQRRAGQIGC
nr:hypothetical protein [Tanacetum cinerariifolium]